MLTAERLRELFDYNPETGVFTRRVRAARMPAGSVADSRDRTTGYIRFGVDGKLQYAHRLAWLYTHGRWPEPNVDHIDGDRTNNRITNLREASMEVNAQNLRHAKSSSATGLLGVESHKDGGFGARIMVAGSRRYLGFFASAEEAHAAYLAAKRKLHEGCTI